MTTYRIEKETLELREEGTGRTWKAARYGSYSGKQDYDVYLNGNGAFKLVRDGGVWVVYNDAPHSSQYSSRKKYLQALARGEHESPELGRFSVKNSPTLQHAMEVSIAVYKDKGWITDDPLSEKLNMRKMRKALAA
jgi:hypothetical protein